MVMHNHNPYCITLASVLLGDPSGSQGIVGRGQWVGGSGQGVGGSGQGCLVFPYDSGITTYES